MILRVPLGRSVVSALVVLAACAASTSPPPPVVAAAPPVVTPLAAPAPSPPAVVVTPAPTASALPASESPAPAVPPKPKGPDTHAWWKHWPKGWTDPRVVSALAVSCDFVPGPPPPPADGSPWADEDMFACTFAMQQTCVRTDCSNEREACSGACEGTCRTCGASCTSDCGSCEAACQDDACRHACAVTTATCKETCGRTMDRCDTGGCAKKETACWDKENAFNAANHCNEHCNAHSKCMSDCDTRTASPGSPENDSNACRTKCAPLATPCKCEDA